MKKLFILLLLITVAFSYLAIPDMTKPEYPEGSDVQPFSLIDKVTIVEINDGQNIGVKQIILTPESETGSMNIKVIVSPALDANISGILYKAMDIEVTKFTGVVDAIFPVEKSWFTQNQVGQEEITLYHLESSAWVMKPISKDSEDSTNVYYKATLPSFSSYAIGTKAEEAPDEPEPVSDDADEGDTEESAGDDTDESGEETQESDNTTMYILLGVALALFLILIAALYFGIGKKDLFKKGKEKHKAKTKQK